MASQLMHNTHDVPASPTRHRLDCGIPEVDLLLIGGPSVITDNICSLLGRLDGQVSS